MATIVSSIIALNTPQVDGRRAIVEVHTDNFGNKYNRVYLAAVGADVNAALTAYATRLLANLGTSEIAANILQVETVGSFASPTFLFSTVSDNVAALRAAYKVATQLQAVMMGDYLNTLTDVQLENAFNLTQAQVTTLRTNFLQPDANTAADIRAAVGS